MSCKLNESCKLIIESKDNRISRLIGERDELIKRIEEYENKETIMKVFLIIQAGLLAVVFQIWN